MRALSLHVVIILFGSLGILRAQSLVNNLRKAGFEQVHTKALHDTLRVFFEKRSFRFPYHSMEYAELLLDSNEVRIPVVWIPLYHNRPMGAYRSGDFRYRPLQESERRMFKTFNDLTDYRFHFRLMPDFNARFGYYSDPFQNKTNLILDTRVYLLPGLSLHTGVLFPIHNSLDNQPMNIRPGPTMLSWLGNRGHHYVAVTAGTYLSARYGLDFQYRYARPDAYLSFGVESTWTGYYAWPVSGLYTEALKDWTGIADLEYRLPPFPGISIRMSGGQFLTGDRGARVDLIRQWGSVDISFFAAATSAGRNAGFQFIVPIFPGTLVRTRRMEFRTSEEFPWEYSFNNEQTVARRYRLSVPRLSEVTRQYHQQLRGTSR